jgi:hypothetical protein
MNGGRIRQKSLCCRTLAAILPGDLESGQHIALELLESWWFLWDTRNLSYIQYRAKYSHTIATQIGDLHPSEDFRAQQWVGLYQGYLIFNYVRTTRPVL